MVDDAKSENSAPNEGTPFVRNPANCTSPYSVDVLLSPFLGSMGATEGLPLIRIKRPPPRRTAGSPGFTTRSPWSIKLMSRRHECTFTYYYQVLLLDEAKLIRNLSCPFIAGANLQQGELADYKCQLAMEYCKVDLAYILSLRYGEDGADGPRPLDVPRATKVVESVLEALNFLHNVAALLHGDLKSFNVLVQGDFEAVKLCGLGRMSHKVDGDGTVEGWSAETVRSTVALGLWSAPELFENRPGTTKADIWSFGLLVFELLTGYPPHTFPGVMDKALAEPNEVLGMRKPAGRRILDVFAMDEDDTDCVMVEDFPVKQQKRRKADVPLVVARKRASEFPSLSDSDFMLDAGGAGGAAGAVAQGWMKRSKTEDGSASEGTGNSEQLTIDLFNDEDDAPKEQEKNGLPNLEATSTPSLTAAPIEPAAGAVQGEVTSSEAKAEAPGGEQALPLAAAKVEAAVAAFAEGTAPGEGENVPGEAAPAAAGKAKKPIDDVVMVLDSSDEDEDEPAFPDRHQLREVLSDEDSEIYDLFDQAGCYDEVDDDEPLSEIDSELEDDNFINYASLGTRPPIPSDIPLGAEYRRLLEVFLVCTRENPADRPTAQLLLSAIKLNADAAAPAPAAAAAAAAATPQSTSPDQPPNN
ncbi:serine/threonine-protein kinase nak1 [Anopheles arabiensis]|uniref:non-specific serine/threonine protein kinase n=1 Tax=Anopheles arabiensis TaxID=7173 RepID=A0A182HIF9_ANOAR|nr:serine/threonine-protein kinase nak1 [Anopheles arabiensis]